MRVKRYEGKSEAALLPIIHEEMGENATIISVKESKSRGLMGFFTGPRVIVTAACEDDEEFLQLMTRPADEDDTPSTPPIFASDPPPLTPTPTPAPTEDISQTMELLLQEARKATAKITKDEAKKESPKPHKKGSANSEAENKNATNPEAAPYAHPMVQQFYDTMCSQDVVHDVAHFILRDLETTIESDDADVKKLMKTVYTGIIDILKDPIFIPTAKPKTASPPHTVVFMGPTGVGKTTTIAKLSSLLSLKYNLRVGLITADTYRIAAVEQLRTYADILGLTVRVVYQPEEMKEHLQALQSTCDIILIDTAGRSHKNKEGISDLQALLAHVPGSIKYLVLSITTKYEDLAKIVSTYDTVADFSLIFTKLDETEALGTLMNLCCLAGKKASYVTFGQNVPDDIEAIKPDKIAKSLLGLNENATHPYTESGVGI
jgi:flagellar biosynthesis protein FlhF